MPRDMCPHGSHDLCEFCKEETRTLEVLSLKYKIQSYEGIQRGLDLANEAVGITVKENDQLRTQLAAEIEKRERVEKERGNLQSALNQSKDDISGIMTDIEWISNNSNTEDIRDDLNEKVKDVRDILRIKRDPSTAEQALQKSEVEKVELAGAVISVNNRFRTQTIGVENCKMMLSLARKAKAIIDQRQEDGE